MAKDVNFYDEVVLLQSPMLKGEEIECVSVNGDGFLLIGFCCKRVNVNLQ